MQTRKPAAALDHASASDNEIMHTTNPIKKHSTTPEISEAARIPGCDLKSRPTWLRYTCSLVINGMSETGHILVAEDDPTDAYFFERAFKRAGIPVRLHFVRDGQEVIDYLRGEGPFADRTAYPLPQLVLLDLKMPRLDGFDVLEWVRGQATFNGLQLVIFSSSDEPRDINRAYGLGANWYLVKPHSMEELTDLVGRFKKFWLEGTNDRGRKAA
jgi:CheY-like chemotaxis protein